MLGFMGYKGSITTTQFSCYNTRVAIDVISMNGCGHVPMKLYLWTLRNLNPYNFHITTHYCFVFPNHMKNVKRTFLVCGQYKNRQSAEFGPWATVCWPLTYTKREVLMKYWKHLLSWSISFVQEWFFRLLSFIFTAAISYESDLLPLFSSVFSGTNLMPLYYTASTRMPGKGSNNVEWVNEWMSEKGVGEKERKKERDRLLKMKTVL